jgi:hypothetical protein
MSVAKRMKAVQEMARAGLETGDIEVACHVGLAIRSILEDHELCTLIATLSTPTDQPAEPPASQVEAERPFDAAERLLRGLAAGKLLALSYYSDGGVTLQLGNLPELGRGQTLEECVEDLDEKTEGLFISLSRPGPTVA